MDVERIWQEAAGAVEVDLEVEVVEEAYEVYVAEAARMRLVDRAGPARLRLHSGALLDGEVTREEPIDGHLRLHLSLGEEAVVPVSRVVVMRDGHARLRPEGSGVDTATVGSWLRSCWLAALPMRVRTVDGATWCGILSEVGADHVGLTDESGDRWLIPFGAVECWIVPVAPA